MDLTKLKRLGPARKEELTSANVRTVRDLAEADLADLSGRVDIPESTLEDLHDQANDLIELKDRAGLTVKDVDRLLEADIRSVDQLEQANMSDVAAAAGVDADQVETWQTELASPTTSDIDEVAEEVREVSDELAQQLAEARVVLEEGITDARVKFEDDVLGEARLLPVKAKEDVDELLDEISGNVVVLREKADEAIVRVEGEISEQVPIFKRRIEQAQDSASEGAEEVRVRVKEIKDNRVLPKAEEVTSKIKDLLGVRDDE